MRRRLLLLVLLTATTIKGQQNRSSGSVVSISDGEYYIAAAADIGENKKPHYLSLHIARDFVIPIVGMIVSAAITVLSVLPAIWYGLIGLPFIMFGTGIAMVMTVSMAMSIPNSKTLSLKEDRAVRWAISHPEDTLKIHSQAFTLQNVWQQTKLRKNMMVTMRGRGPVKRLTLHKKEAMPIIAIQSEEVQDAVYLRFLGSVHNKPDLWLYLKRGEAPALHETKKDLWKLIPVAENRTQTGQDDR